MAMRSNGPILLSLPAFRGVTRRLILLSLLVFFALVVLSLGSRELSGSLLGAIVLSPQQALHWHLWQLLSYPFADLNLISVALSLLSLWFFGSALEDERGPRWMTEFFLAATIGGGLLASLSTYLDPAQFGITQSVYFLAVAVVGGMSSPFGAIVGSAIFILIPDLLQSFQSYLGLVFALLLLGFIVLRPNGLASVALSRYLGLAWLRTAGGER